MQKFWAQNFVPNNAALIVSGQISAADLRPLAAKAFGDWARGTPAQPALGAPATTSARVVLVDKPGAPQTQVRVASIGVPRATSDYEALNVLNETLGGLFSSRINLNLREQHGYTYGARSQFVFRRSAGPFFVSSGVRTDVTAPAVAEIFKEVRRIRESRSRPRSSLAKDQSSDRCRASSRPRARMRAAPRRSTSTTSCSITTRRRPARLSSVTADSQGIRPKNISCPQLLVIAVGDRARIGPELAKLNLGAVE